jgi:hypothetical protein
MSTIFKSSIFLVILLTFTVNTYAQSDTTDATTLVRKKFYWSSSLDMFIFSSSIMEKAPASSQLTTLRFTYFPNFGFNFNYDISKHVGLFTGINLKNIGFTEKIAIADSTIKRRVLTLGAPLGIKFGNINKHSFAFAGGGVDVPVNYKQKGYIRRGNKDKFNEWFSDRTPLIMPYVFAGFSYSPGISIKLQYYPVNFLNTGFTEVSQTNIPGSTGTSYIAPYAAYTKTNLMLISVGFDVRYGKKSKKVGGADKAETQTM